MLPVVIVIEQLLLTTMLPGNPAVPTVSARELTDRVAVPVLSESISVIVRAALAPLSVAAFVLLGILTLWAFVGTTPNDQLEAVVHAVVVPSQMLSCCVNAVSLKTAESAPNNTRVGITPWNSERTQDCRKFEQASATTAMWGNMENHLRITADGQNSSYWPNSIAFGFLLLSDDITTGRICGHNCELILHRMIHPQDAELDSIVSIVNHKETIFFLFLFHL